MQIQNKIKIDRRFGGPLAYLMNLAARCLGWLMRRDHRFPERPRVICVAKFSGLGSIVASLPMLRALKEKYPDAALVYLSSKNNAALLERINLLDKRLYVSESSLGAVIGSTLMLLWRLWCLRPDLYVDLEIYSYYASIMATVSCARNRLGFYRKSTQVKEGLFTHLVFFNTSAPVHQLYLQLARTAGCNQVSAMAHRGLLRPLPRDREEAARELENWLTPPQRLLVVNPNASDLCLERRWPGENFVQVLGRLLAEMPDLHAALVGSGAERGYVSGIEAQLAPYGERVRNLAGVLSLGGFLALLERADVFLTNDSGPMHMALALGRPTVSLWGPGDPGHYANPADPVPHIVLYEPVLCSPCIYQSDLPPCGGDNQCMQALEVDSVVKACRALLSPQGGQPEEPLDQVWRRPQIIPKLTDEHGQPLGVVTRPGPAAKTPIGRS